MVENASVPFDRRVWREACTLRDAGARVTVVSPRGRETDQERFVRLDGIDVHRFTVPLEGTTASGALSVWRYLAEYGFSVLAMAWLAVRVYMGARVDVIHVANPPDCLFLVPLLFRPFGVRFVFDHHDLVPESYLDKKPGSEGGPLLRVQELLERWSFRLADIVIATNESYREIAVTRGDVPRERVFVVRNGPDLTRFHRVAPNRSARAGARFLVGYMGIMGSLDGVDVLVRGAAHLRHVRGRKDIRYVLVGAGPCFRTVQDLARELRVDDVMTFTGRLNDADALAHLSACDCFASPDPPSRLNEVSTMNKIMEFMALERPLVSFDLLEARRSAGEAAVYVTEPTPEAFGDALAALLDDPAALARRGAIARERVAERLCWAVTSRSLLRAYATLFGERDPQPTGPGGVR